MGAETSAFQDLELEDELQLTGEHGWTLHDGLTREGTRVSVFVHGKATANVELVQHAAKVRIYTWRLHAFSPGLSNHIELFLT